MFIDSIFEVRDEFVRDGHKAESCLHLRDILVIHGCAQLIVGNESVVSVAECFEVRFGTRSELVDGHQAGDERTGAESGDIIPVLAAEEHDYGRDDDADGERGEHGDHCIAPGVRAYEIFAALIHLFEHREGGGEIIDELSQEHEVPEPSYKQYKSTDHYLKRHGNILRSESLQWIIIQLMFLCKNSIFLMHFLYA